MARPRNGKWEDVPANRLVLLTEAAAILRISRTQLRQTLWRASVHHRNTALPDWITPVKECGRFVGIIRMEVKENTE